MHFKEIKENNLIVIKILNILHSWRSECYSTVIFLLLEEISLAFLTEWIHWWHTFLVLFMQNNLHFLKAYIILSWLFIFSSFSTLNVYFQCLLVAMIADLFFSVYHVFFSLTVLKNFSIFLIIKCLNIVFLLTEVNILFLHWRKNKKSVHGLYYKALNMSHIVCFLPHCCNWYTLLLNLTCIYWLLVS